ncbi:MAG: UpxY family transcription antiterminator [Flavobacteriaceae bacterium]|nr:UpxY family transcription antiterminator [Flavobacteriaceae bacterium]
MNWFVLYTKPQQELKVLERLKALDIDAYCPVVEEVRQWSDRKKRVSVPLIKSYVFVRIDFANRSKVFDVPGVVRYLFWLGKPALVSDKEINALRDSLKESCLTVKVERLSIGERLIIDKGPFQSKEGTVIKLSANYVTVALEQLGLLVTISY